MSEEECKKELGRCLKVVFDAIPKGRKPFPMQEASFVEVLAKHGVASYLEMHHPKREEK